MSEIFGGSYSGYYDLFYQDKNYSAEAQYVHALIRAHLADGPKAKHALNILELGCGTGRHAEWFMDEGHVVVGIDQSEHMVNLARSRLGDRGRSRFCCSEIAGLNLDERFDAVFSLFHVLSYQVTNEALLGVLNAASAHLDPGGVLVCDFWHAPGVSKDPPSCRIKRVENGDIRVTRIAEPSMNWEKGVANINYDVLIEDKKTGGLQRELEMHPMRFFSANELDLACRLSGLRMRACVGWMSFDRAASEQDWYGVLVAVKPN